MSDDDTFHLKPQDDELLDQLYKLSEYVLDVLEEGEERQGDDAIATFFVNSGRAEMYRRLRRDGMLPVGHNPELERRLSITKDDDEPRFYQ